MRHTTFWDSLDHDERKMMTCVGRVPRHPFESGDTILRQSDHADRAALIISGKCRVLWHGEQNRTTYLATRRAGELIGEMGVLDGGPRTATVIALEQTYVRWYAAEAFMQLLAECPAILGKVFLSVCTRLKESDHHRIAIASAPARLRLGRLLLRLAEVEGVTTPRGVEIKVTQKDLGDWTGMGREAAGSRVRELQKLAFLADSPARSRVTVIDLAGLRRYAFGAEGPDGPSV
ncbi:MULTISPECIES: Crp/Fnr family transcriptional regulator [Streptomyces]|uniref:Crp/Fnr family transcriptional regulator n=1 Tax=Streptomyces TaxID=1883 RepID=UPI002A75BABD|nr:Crp/Fnr family transcriptional regulator [Streptomyces sp. CL7]WPP30636.1 Crp/Fnr family transcriptional regulator [Streptomyces sp. CL7]